MNHLKAIECFKKSIAANQSVKHAYLHIGTSLRNAGEREEAIKYYRKILKLKNGAGAQFLAQRDLNEPAKRGDPFLAY